jgi:hypothetical protein
LQSNDRPLAGLFDNNGCANRTHHRAAKPIATTVQPSAAKPANVPEKDRDPADIALDQKLKAFAEGAEVGSSRRWIKPRAAFSRLIAPSALSQLSALLRCDLARLLSLVTVHHGSAAVAEIYTISHHAGPDTRNVGNLGAAKTERVAGAHLLCLRAKRIAWRRKSQQ